MHLTPREIDKLVLHGAGFLAQKRLARGLRLNYPEAVALIATQLLELDPRRPPRRRADGPRPPLLGRAQVLPGVPELVAEVQVEGTFPDGTKLVTVHHPIARRARRPRARALRQLPAGPAARGASRRRAGRAGRRAARARSSPRRARSSSTRGARRSRSRSPTSATGPIQVGSHYPSRRRTARSTSTARAPTGTPARHPRRHRGPLRARRDAHRRARRDRGRRIVRGGNALATARQRRRPRVAATRRGLRARGGA